MHIFLYSISLIYILKCIQSNYTCTEKDKNADCSNVKIEEVCGVFNKSVNCVTYPCGVDKKSVCEACKEINVELVELMTCNDLKNKVDSGSTDNNNIDSNTTEPIKEKCSLEEFNRPLEECSKEPTEEYCGWYDTQKVKCLSSPCAETVENRCYACQEKFAYISKRKCPSSDNNEEVSNTSDEKTSYRCTEEDRTKLCTKEWTGVCGYLDKNSCKENCTNNYGTFCQACNNKEVLYAVSGKCLSTNNEEPLPYIPPEDNSYICNEKDRNIELCNEIYSPVCGHPEECNKGERCDVQYTNNCKACVNPNIYKTYKGECLPKTEKIMCEETDRNKLCTQEYVGFCAVKFDSSCKDSQNCYFDIGTKCQACSNIDVEYVYNTQCNNIFRPEISLTSEIRTFSEDNSVQNSNNDEKIFCKTSDRQATCSNNYEGVCAFKYSNCDNLKDNCNFTSYNYCTACKMDDVEYVINKVCENPPSSKEDEEKAYESTIIEETDDKKSEINDEDDNINKTDKSQDTNKNTTIASLKADNEKREDKSYIEAKECKEDDRDLDFSNEKKPVCGYKICTSGLCPSKEANRINACINKDIIYTVDLDCKDVNINRLIVPCPEDRNNELCKDKNTLVKTKVCGKYYKNSKFCLNESCKNEFENSCLACYNKEIKEYVPVTCKAEEENKSANLIYNALLLFICLFILF